MADSGKLLFMQFDGYCISSQLHLFFDLAQVAP